jgi:hypothetical protein
MCRVLVDNDDLKTARFSAAIDRSHHISFTPPLNALDEANKALRFSHESKDGAVSSLSDSSVFADIHTQI